VVGVNVSDGRALDRNFIRMDEVGALQQPLDFLA
jgi:hypothetical protein